MEPMGRTEKLESASTQRKDGTVLASQQDGVCFGALAKGFTLSYQNREILLLF